MEYTITLQKKVIASLNEGSLKSNNSAGNEIKNSDRSVMSAPSVLKLFYTKSLTTENGSATKNLAVNITKMDSRSATPNPDVPKPRAGNLIQAKEVKNAIALAENSLAKDTNKPPTLEDGYQGNKPGEWTQIVSTRKKSSMRPRPAGVRGGYIGDPNPLSPSVAEHWCNPSSLAFAIIPGYTQAAAFFCTSSIPGGTLIFVKYDLIFKIVEIAELCVERYCEFCAVKLKFK
ncbi:hypothetical protein WA026_002403 [Henosepilachna vigintioctopunctata]|uniref:Uncharacterized protein n=1 Tax=Henosepilachna vigintioctopunctata TaxID=420089 RepID=A0AAW1TR90_9CUCU